MKVPYIDRTLPPTGSVRPFVQFLRPNSPQGFSAVILCREILVTRTHWKGGRTTPCTGDSCWCNEEGKAARIRAYCSCMLRANNATGILELTHGAAEQLNQLVTRGSELRGVCCHLRRRDKRPQSPVDVQLIDWKSSAPLPAPIDPLPYLLKIWGLRLDLSFRSYIGPSPISDRETLNHSPEEWFPDDAQAEGGEQ